MALLYGFANLVNVRLDRRQFEILVYAITFKSVVTCCLGWSLWGKSILTEMSLENVGIFRS